MQAELPCHRGELLRTRLVQTQPSDRVASQARGVQLGEVVRLGSAAPITVDGAVDDHARTLYGGTR